MKKSLFLGLVAVVGLVGCSRNQEIDIQENGLSLIAKTEGSTDSRTVVEDQVHVYWEPGDEIMVYNGEKSAKFVSELTASSATATFKGTFGEKTWLEDIELWAVYPYSEDAVFDGETITTVLPSEQIARAGSFGKDMNLAVAHNTGSTLQFYNVGGGIRFSITEDGIKKVMFEGLSGEIISGKVKIGLEDGLPVVQEVTGGSQFITLLPPSGKETFEKNTWYYIVAIPGTLEGGYKLRFYKDSDYARKVSEKAVEIKRSIYGSIEKADNGVEYEEQTTHFPITTEEIQESEQVTLDINAQVNEIFSQAGYYDLESDELDLDGITSAISRVEGVLSAKLLSSEKMITVMKKDSTIINFDYDNSDWKSDDSSVGQENIMSQINALLKSQSRSSSGSTKKALLLSPFQNSYIAPNGEQVGKFRVDDGEIRELLASHGFSLNFLPDDKASLEMFTGDFMADYDLVMIVSHGGGIGDVWTETTVVSGSEIYPSAVPYLKEIYRDSWTYSRIGDIPRYAIQPKWLEKTFHNGKKFPGSIIYVGSCHSYDVDDLKNVFTRNGASAYYGYVGETPYVKNGVSVTGDLLKSVVRSLCRGMDADKARDFTLIDNDLWTPAFKSSIYLWYGWPWNWSFDYFKVNPEAKQSPVFLVDPRPKDLHASVDGNIAKLSWKCDYALDACEYIVHTDGRNFSFDPSLNQSVSVPFDNPGTYPWSIITNVYARTTSSDEPVIVASYRVDGEPFTVKEGPSVTIKTYSPTNIGPCSAEIPFTISTDEVVNNFGIIYSTNITEPVVGNYGNGNYIAYYNSEVGTSMIIKNLKPNTTYYARAIITLNEENGEKFYGNTVQFTTKGLSYSTEYVDLGLSVSWATCNLGSSTPSNVGGYYGWGETIPTSLRASYKWSGPDGFTKYNANDGKITLEASDDAAYVNLGGKWRMPTSEEITELRNNCTWVQTSKNGVLGSSVTGPNGKSIFIPISEGHTRYLEASILSSSLATHYDGHEYVQALSYHYLENYVYFLSTFRDRGTPIRPVYDDSDSKPNIIASPTTLNYGNVKVGQSLGNAAGRVEFTNTGGATLSITSIDCPEGFSHSPSLSFPITVSPGDSKTITFAFRPTEVKPYSGYIQVYSNASNGVCKVKVTGYGIE